MLKDVFTRLEQWWSTRAGLPVITERTRLKELIRYYPDTAAALEARFGISLEARALPLSLARFCQTYSLPAPQIVFMEIQMYARAQKVRLVLPREVVGLIKDETLRVLDVREPWEHKWGSLPRAQTLSVEGMETALSQWPKDQALLFYCHFGVRSLDAAVYFTDRGFANVLCLKGGIDAWASDVDRTLERYESAWC